jgi:hypothetical protein
MLAIAESVQKYAALSLPSFPTLGKNSNASKLADDLIVS